MSTPPLPLQLLDMRYKGGNRQAEEKVGSFQLIAFNVFNQGYVESKGVAQKADMFDIKRGRE